MPADINTVLLAQLSRLENAVEGMRDKQDSAAVAIATVGTKLEAKDERLDGMGKQLGDVASTVDRIKIEMAVAQAKAGGLAGLIGGSLAAGLIKVLEYYLALPQ